MTNTGSFLSPVKSKFIIGQDNFNGMSVYIAHLEPETVRSQRKNYFMDISFFENVYIAI